jgi:hypothetical protein
MCLQEQQNYAKTDSQLEVQVINTVYIQPQNSCMDTVQCGNIMHPSRPLDTRDQWIVHKLALKSQKLL